MASVNFMKCKAGTGLTEAVLGHCDKDERLKRKHGNVHIDKTVTPENIQGNRNYEQTLQALRDRLAELDSVPGANTRSDRVEMFMLEIPIPDEYEKSAFRNIVMEQIYAMYGRENVLNWYFHMDEVHEYMENGEITKSCMHLHVPVVPVVDGKLNGKQFSSSRRMVALNKAIDEACQRQLGGKGFLKSDITYDKHADKRHAASVERLKINSFKELNLAVQEKEARLSQLRQQVEEQTQAAVDASRRLELIRQEMETIARGPSFKEAEEHAVDKQELETIQKDYPEMFGSDGRYIPRRKREREKNKEKDHKSHPERDGQNKTIKE